MNLRGRVIPILLITCLVHLSNGSESHNQEFGESPPSMSSQSAKIFYEGFDKVDQRLTISQIDALVSGIKYGSAYTSDFSIHRYDDQEDLDRATGPEFDSSRCQLEINAIHRRIERLAVEGYNSTDTNLYQLLDTFGRISSGFLLGNLFFPGEYSECINMKIKGTTSDSIGTRFCWAMMRHRRHRHEPIQLDESLADEWVKVGVCLPRVCHTKGMARGNNMDLIASWFDHPTLHKGELQVAELYCLPDEDSPLRAWYTQRATILTIMVFTCWILLQIFATFSKSPALEPLSITSNFNKLFHGQAKDDETRYSIDLEVANGLKVLAMINIISAHSLFLAPVLFADPQNLSKFKSPLYILNYFFGLLMVEIFMSTTGFLTCYLLHKRNEVSKFITRPLHWIYWLVSCYFRIIVVYAAVVAYAKYIGKYTGSGPFWDYGTSSLSLRKTCELESWWWTLLLIANFKDLNEHCVPAGWYLALNFQFLVLSTIFMYALHKNRRLGWLIALGCIVVGLVLTTSSLYNSELEDSVYLGLVTFKPDAWAISFKTFMREYTLIWYRIPSFLCGFLLGDVLFHYEKEVRNYYNGIKSQDTFGNRAEIGRPKLPYRLDEFGPVLCALGAAIYILTPYLIPAIMTSATTARWFFAVFSSAMRLLVDSLVGVLLTLGATGGGSQVLNNFLSAPFWRPLARVLMCALVVNFEWIMVFIQRSTHTDHASSYLLACLYLTNVIAVFCISLLVGCLIDSPARNLLNILLNSHNKSKQDDGCGEKKAVKGLTMINIASYSNTRDNETRN